jgi:hypothetical protein
VTTTTTTNKRACDNEGCKLANDVAGDGIIISTAEPMKKERTGNMEHDDLRRR